MSQRFQVLIVGGGPVGVALAVELGRRGVSVGLVERHRTPQRIPKGQSLTQRTLEHFYSWGIADQLRAARLLPPGYPIGSLTAYGNLMSDYWFGPDTRERVLPYYFEKNERLPQYLTEEVLRARIADFPNVQCFFGQTARTIRQDDSRRDASTSPTRTGHTRSRRSKPTTWLAATARARCVREQLGIDRGGADFDQRMVLAVFRSRQLHEGLEPLSRVHDLPRTPPGPAGLLAVFRPRRRGRRLVLPRAGAARHHAGQLRLSRADSARRRISVRSGVRPRRLLGPADLGGESVPGGPRVHRRRRVPQPSTVRRLRTELRAGGRGQPRLEAGGASSRAGAAMRCSRSYGEERRPIFVETGEAMIAGGIEADRVFLDRYRPERDQAEFARSVAELGQRAGSRRQSYEPHYEGSSIVAGPPDGVCSIHGKYSFEAQAGHHLSPAAAVQRAERVRGARRRISRCWRSARRGGRERFLGGGADAARAAEGCARHGGGGPRGIRGAHGAGAAGPVCGVGGGCRAW